MNSIESFTLSICIFNIGVFTCEEKLVCFSHLESMTIVPLLRLKAENVCRRHRQSFLVSVHVWKSPFSNYRHYLTKSSSNINYKNIITSYEKLECSKSSLCACTMVTPCKQTSLNQEKLATLCKAVNEWRKFLFFVEYLTSLSESDWQMCK